jgi:hypothetical protein
MVVIAGRVRSILMVRSRRKAASRTMARSAVPSFETRPAGAPQDEEGRGYTANNLPQPFTRHVSTPAIFKLFHTVVATVS